MTAAPARLRRAIQICAALPAGPREGTAFVRAGRWRLRRTGERLTVGVSTGVTGVPGPTSREATKQRACTQCQSEHRPSKHFHLNLRLTHRPAVDARARTTSIGDSPIASNDESYCRSLANLPLAALAPHGATPALRS